MPNGSIHLDDLKRIFEGNVLCSGNDGRKILLDNVDNSYRISEKDKRALDMWCEFKIGTNHEKTGVPVWVEYFGYNLSDEEYKIRRDHKGQTIDEMPNWKQRFVNKNRSFYLKHKNFIDKWIKKYNVLELPLVYQKLEWNCGDETDLKNTIIQFRQSGIRIKKFNYFPALVAINNTPIIYDYNMKYYRKITPREAANLQSFRSNYDLSDNPQIYKQLGNAVNVEIIERLAKELFAFEKRSD